MKVTGLLVIITLILVVETVLAVTTAQTQEVSQQAQNVGSEPVEALGGRLYCTKEECLLIGRN